MTNASSLTAACPSSPSKARQQKPGRRRAAATPAGLKLPLKGLALPDPTTMTATSAAGAYDFLAARDGVPNVALVDVDNAAARLKAAGAAVGKADLSVGRGHDALLGALSGFFAAAADLCRNPPLIYALCERAGVRLTRATTTSAFLPIIKLAVPRLDPKARSLYASALNHGLACNLDAFQFRAVLDTYGVKGLAKREVARRRVAKGGPVRPTDAEIVEGFRNDWRTLAIDGLELPAGHRVALLVVGEVDGELRAFAFDDEPKRLLAAIRRAKASGAELPALAEPIDEAAEGDDPTDQEVTA